MRVTVVQMNPGANKADNIAQATRLIEAAVAEDKPDIVSLPEVWDSLGGDRTVRNANAELQCHGARRVMEQPKQPIDLRDVLRPVTFADKSQNIPAVSGLVWAPIFVNGSIIGASPGYYNPGNGVTVSVRVCCVNVAVTARSWSIVSWQGSVRAPSPA